MAHPFFTIGHATRSIEEFVALLRGSSVTFVADVRTVPRSRTNPQYNRETLPQSLATVSIGYEHIASLGGLRGRKREVPRETNAFWQNDSFHNYADHAMGAAFHDGLAHLRELGQVQRCAIMCAETLWWRCHRRIITDYLLAAGETVFHILGPGQVDVASINPAAHVLPDGRLDYPAQAPTAARSA
ncbi:DUF488 domain-containing protein [Bradyrhizobium sp. CCBAU 51627]|uniref:DUF488 domain-containing protein n=1 Tax=Bradyrhizobium sp. CCBAU 51627 TaxID=1325088 RepID=UPI0023050F61|nr:DUF488 domain-containing protein [Bradyrhizobium sp. CCBAU 51627]MDA9432419.1 DNA repair protein [Bradyrhizobium sp. CCBAU 51627]